MSQSNNSLAGGNATPFKGFHSYTPTLTGATDNPVVTATTSIGRYMILNGIAFFTYTLISSSMTKTTTSDQVRMSLPIAAAVRTGQVTNFSARVENATAVANMGLGEIGSGAAYHTFRNYALAANSSVATYASTTPGLGTLTNTITFEASGWYEI